MDKNELAQRLMATFLEELHEHVINMNRDLLALEKGPSGDEREEVLKVLFRSAHSLKGASRAVSVEIIESACHKAEDILDAVRKGQREFTPALASLLLRTVDAIEEAGTRLRSEQDLGDAPLHALIPALESVADGEEPAEVALPVESGKHDSDSDNGWQSGTATREPEPIAEMERNEAASPPDAPAVPASEPANLQVRTAAAHTTIRVPAEKLDSLLTKSGELLVARRRVEFRAGDAAAACESAAVLRNEWRALVRPLRTFCGDDTDKVPAALDAALTRRTSALFDRTSERITELTKNLDKLAANLLVDSRLLGQTCEMLDDEVYRVRMLPFVEACGGLERAVRDLANATGKKVELLIEGEDVEVDRSVLEGLKDPLLHLVRNAIDHGIESPAQRQAAGKPATGRLTVSAALRGGQVEVVVADDGRGFDLERIRAKATRQGLAVPDDDRDLVQLAFTAGFSMAPIVTDVSGRGVGLDVVQSQIESLHGAVDVSFVAGAGTRFILTVPLTLTTIRCMLAVAADQTYAIPTTTVEHIVRFDAHNVRSMAGREIVLLGGTPTPIASLTGTLGMDEQHQRLGRKTLAIVLAVGEQKAAFVVDEVTAEQEVLVKNLGARIHRLRHISGATLLPSGDVALVLNVPNLIRTAFGQRPGRSIAAETLAQVATDTKRVLAVDDSMTTRTLLKSILEAAGFDVTVAVDGQHAWELMQAESFDIVVSDVDMARMDGFELTTMLRNSPQHAELPVVLVTARGSDEDKMRGIQVGANAYLVKSGFDQGNLLDVIGQLI